MQPTDDGLRGEELLREIRRVHTRVQRKSRWHGWVWLVLALATPVFVGSTALDADLLPLDRLWLAIGFMLLAGVLAVWEVRRPVVSSAARKADRPVTWGYVVAVIAALAATRWLNDGPRWALMAAALLPALPSFIGAWIVLRR